jgi:uncharacterized cupin superfamily protein
VPVRLRSCGRRRACAGRTPRARPSIGSNAEYGDFYHHAEDEFVTVIAGRVVIDLADDGEFVLGCGDSVYYDGDTPHRWRSADRGAYRLLIVKQRLQKEPV